MDIAKFIKFCDICKVMERVKSAKTVQRKEVILRRYYLSFSKYRQSFRQKIGVQSNHPEDGKSSFYSVLRLFIPGADKERNNYGMQITALGRLYGRVLQLAKESDDAMRLMYKNCTSVGDYADVVYSVLLARCNNKQSHLTLEQIHNMLDMIASEETTVKEREIIRFAELASPEEQKWFIRILLKSMSLGIGEGRIFNMLHPTAKNIYQHCTDLKRICNLLADKHIPVSEKAFLIATKSIQDPLINFNELIKPFQQVRPMLCERFSGNVEELMKLDVLYLETKMDGERFQLHYVQGRFKYISRNGADYTACFGSSYEFGSLTPHLRTLLPMDMVSIILDGEMMIWDKQCLRYRQKGESVDVKHLKEEGRWRPCFVVYDILYLNGKSILDMTYVQRAYKLHEMLNEQQGILQIMKGHKINSVEHFNLLFQQLLESHEEGIVLKKQNSIYLPGQRVGGGWYKEKADYITGIITDFDVLIIGGFYNRKRTFIDSFLLGVLKISGDCGYEVYSIGCVANNTRQRSILLHDLSPYWQITAQEPPPIWYHYKPNERYGCPDVWVCPDKSIILQVRAADLTPNKSYFTQKSLHFPRIQHIRDDKVWNECMTLHEYTELCQDRGAIQKLSKRHLDIYDISAERKRQKLTPANFIGLRLSSSEKRHFTRPLKNISEVLNGLSFCILSSMRGYSKHQLETLIAENGGSIVQNPLPEDPNCICLCGDRTYFVERLMQQQPQTNNILYFDWILRVCKNQRINLCPKDVLSTTNALQAQLAQNFDKLGDTFEDFLLALEDLQEVLLDICETELDFKNIQQSDLNNLAQKLLGFETISFFSENFGCFYNRNGNQLEKLLFKQHNGQLVTELEEMNEIYIFLCSDCLDRQYSIQCHRGNSDRSNVKIVSTDWIWKSHKKKCAQPATDFYC